MKFLVILFGVAYVLQLLSPWIMEKWFPQALLAPAPDVPVRPKRTASRNDAHVDSSVNQLDNVKQALGLSSLVPQEIDGLVATDSSAMERGQGPAEMHSTFDYDEYRPTVREDLQDVQGAHGVPDIYENEVTNAHA
jgi:hypothetical protein